jgi:hypothetical protein
MDTVPKMRPWASPTRRRPSTSSPPRGPTGACLAIPRATCLLERDLGVMPPRSHVSSSRSFVWNDASESPSSPQRSWLRTNEANSRCLRISVTRGARVGAVCSHFMFAVAQMRRRGKRHDGCSSAGGLVRGPKTPALELVRGPTLRAVWRLSCRSSSIPGRGCCYPEQLSTRGARCAPDACASSGAVASPASVKTTASSAER